MMTDTTQELAPRKRRYLRAWALIGAAGLITGAAYASGFAVTPAGTATDTADGASTNVPGTPGVDLSSLYSNTVTAIGPFDTPTFDGVYAEFPKTQLFEIDLSGNDAYGDAYAGGTFYADVFVTNWTALSPAWSQLNFKVLQSGTACGVTTDFDGVGPFTSKQVSVERVDAHVTFSGLAGGSKYCIGLRGETAASQAATASAAVGGAIDGTFMTRPDPDTVPAALPQFTAVVNRSA